MKNNLFTGVVAIVLVGVIVFIGLQQNNDDGLVWVDVKKVYDEFDYKKELETKIVSTQKARQVIVDSAEFELQVLSRQIKAEGGKDEEKISIYEIKRNRYYSLKQDFDNDNANMQQQYNDKILTQINQYLVEFGTENHYKYVFGNNGGTSLIFADEENEVTEEVIIFINEKYHGKTK